MLGHDCKSCPQNNNCELQVMENQAGKAYNEGGIKSLTKWVFAHYHSPQQFFIALEVGAHLILDKEGLSAMADYRGAMEAESKVAGYESAEKALPHMLRRVAFGMSKGMIERAITVSKAITESLCADGKGPEVTIMELNKDQMDSIDKVATSKPTETTVAEPSPVAFHIMGTQTIN